MIKQTYVNKKYIISGFKDDLQKDSLILTGFNNKIFKVFDTEKEAKEYIKKVLEDE